MNRITTPTGHVFEVSDEVAEKLLREQLEMTSAPEHQNRPAMSPRQKAAWDVLREFPLGLSAREVGEYLGITTGAASQRLKTLGRLGMVSVTGKGIATMYYPVKEYR